MTLHAHWSQVDPGPITLHTREQRTARLERERDHELARLQAWLDAVKAELVRSADFYEAAIAREKRRPLRPTNPTRRTA